MIPALALGLLMSGIIHEFIPENWVERYLGGKGIRPIMLATMIGAIAPVCCWGSLPIALSFRKKGATLGPVFSILVATPATSISAVFVTYRFMGLKFAIYAFFAVIIIGLIMGSIGEFLDIKITDRNNGVLDNKTEDSCHCCSCGGKSTFWRRVRGALKFAFIDMPKEIGLQLIIGLFLAALVTSVAPIGFWIKSYLAQGCGYLFVILYGLIMYMCATCSVPLVHAFVNQGLNIGAGMCLLLLGPVVSYATILVLKKEFGFKVLVVFVASIAALCLLTGYLYTFI
ncbi:MAG: permease [Candidatus Omnitrophica bacterium]|nr:permease [Candidatus Omnitrophota bacterium]